MRKHGEKSANLHVNEKFSGKYKKIKVLFRLRKDKLDFDQFYCFSQFLNVFFLIKTIQKQISTRKNGRFLDKFVSQQINFHESVFFEFLKLFDSFQGKK